MNVKELTEKKNDLITRAEETLNKAKEEKRELTDAEMAELAEIRDNVRKIVKALDLDEFFDRIDKKPKEEAKPLGGEEMKTEEEVRKEKEVSECRAFENYIRGFKVHERAGELTKADNGAVIPTTIVNRIIKKVYNICPILDRSQKFNVKGKLDLPYYPADSDNITVAYQTEFSPLVSSSGKFASIELTGFLAGFVVDEMAYAIKRFIEKELLIGTYQKVTGLSTLTNSVTAASSTAITADEVIELHDSIKDEFQNNAIWIMSPATRTALRTLKSSTGYYLLNDDISTPFGTSLLGKPVYVSDNMPNMAAGNTAIFYGDMRGLATKFSEDINIEVLRERFADEHAYGVVGWFEFDAKVCDEQQIAKLVMKSN